MTSQIHKTKHSYAYGVFIALTIVTAMIFLTDTSAGTDAAWTDTPLDDAWIHFVYARNLAEQGGFYYNPGVPEAGFTSPLWVMALALPFKLLLPLGVGPVAISKILGVGLAALTSILAYHLAREYTGSRWAGILAGILVALDPTYAFMKVAGMEGALFANLMLLTLLLLAQRRFAWGGIALGLAVLARPEGWLIVGIVAGGWLAARAANGQFARQLWRGREQPSPGTAEGKRALSARDLGALLIPALVMSIPLAIFYFSVNGTPFPNTFHAKQQISSFVVGNFFVWWTGYVKHLAYFAGLNWLAAIPLTALGGWVAFRKKSLLSLPLFLMPLALCLGIAMILPTVEQGWNFSGRRYLDPIIPLVCVLLALGIWQAARFAQVRRAARWAGYAGAGIVLLFWAAQGYQLWDRLPGEFSWNAHNVYDLDVQLAYWLADNLPPTARIALHDAGAPRYFGSGTMFDLQGLNTHQAIDRGPLAFMRAYQVEYATLFPNPWIDSWPYARRIHTITIENNTIMGNSTIGVYEMDWEPVFADKHTWYATDTAGWTLIDAVDIGNAEAERLHNYQVGEKVSQSDIEMRTAAHAVVWDDGQAYAGQVGLSIATRPNTDLLVVKRYQTRWSGAIEVFANEVYVGEWVFRQEDQAYLLGEHAFVVPGQFIQGNVTHLVFRQSEDNPRGANDFYYWFFVPR